MFKKILQFSLVVALVVARNPLEDSLEYDGLCMEFDEVVYWCTAGSPLQEKWLGALSSCASDGWKGKNEGKGQDLFAADEKCPSVDQVEAWFREKYQGKQKTL